MFLNCKKILLRVFKTDKSSVYQIIYSIYTYQQVIKYSWSYLGGGGGSSLSDGEGGNESTLV